MESSKEIQNNTKQVAVKKIIELNQELFGDDVIIIDTLSKSANQEQNQKQAINNEEF